MASTEGVNILIPWEAKTIKITSSQGLTEQHF